MNQTYYSLQINTISACFDIKINDIPLYADRQGKPTAVEFPINHLLIKGLNILQVSISPAKHENEFADHSKTNFEIYSRDINDAMEKRILIAAAEFPDYINDEKLKKATIPSKKEFLASLLLEAPLWSTAPVFKLNEQTINEIMTIYREYFNALKSKNTDAVFKLTRVKDKVYADTSYQSLNTHLNKLREDFKEIFEDPANQHIDFDIQKKKPELHAFGKLITIMNDENRSPLLFYNGDTGVSTSYKIYLCMKDEKLTIVL